MGCRTSGTRGIARGALLGLVGWRPASRVITVATSCTPGAGWPGGILGSYRRSNGRRSWRLGCGLPCWRKPTTSLLVRWVERTFNGEACSVDAWGTPQSPSSWPRCADFSATSRRNRMRSVMRLGDDYREASIHAEILSIVGD